jgi:hypothetical protein
MSTRVSQLPTAARPLSGYETVVMNQEGLTVTAVLSDIKLFTNDGLSSILLVSPLSVIPGEALTASVSGLKVLINGNWFTIPLLA